MNVRDFLVWLGCSAGATGVVFLLFVLAAHLLGLKAAP